MKAPGSSRNEACAFCHHCTAARCGPCPRFHSPGLTTGALVNYPTAAVVKSKVSNNLLVLNWTSMNGFYRSIACKSSQKISCQVQHSYPNPGAPRGSMRATPTFEGCWSTALCHCKLCFSSESCSCHWHASFEGQHCSGRMHVAMHRRRRGPQLFTEACRWWWVGSRVEGKNREQRCASGEAR